LAALLVGVLCPRRAKHGYENHFLLLAPDGGLSGGIAKVLSCGWWSSLIACCCHASRHHCSSWVCG